MYRTHYQPPHPNNPRYNEAMEKQRIREWERQKRTEEQKIQEAFRNEKNKESTWTHTKLATLALHWAEKRKGGKKNPKESQLPPGSIQHNLDEVPAILDNHFGDPGELRSDIDIIAKGLEDEKFIIDGNEMQAVTVPGKKYLFGLLLQKHIFDAPMGFTVHKDKNGKIVLTDPSSSTNPQRLEKKAALERELNVETLGFNILDGLDENIAALAYRGNNNLPRYRDDLLRKLWKGTPTLESIGKSQKLTAEEKSFLLSWHDPSKNGALQDVQKEQEKFVKNAAENFGKKTMEQHIEEWKKRPLSKAIELMGSISPLIIPGAIIVGALAFFLGKDSKIMKFFAVLFWAGILLGGGKNLINAADDLIEGSTKVAQKGLEKGWEVIGGAKELGEKWMEKVQRFYQRFSAGTDQWTPILMKPDIGNKLTNYPAGALLYTLYSDSPEEQKEFSAYNNNPKNNDIAETLKELNQTEKQHLIALMRNAWDRQKDISSAKVLNDTNLNNDDAGKLTLGKMIQEIDDRDSWWNTLPSWVGVWNGRFYGPLSQNTMKTEALKIMAWAKENKNDPSTIASNIEKWGQLTIGDLRNYFNPFDDKKITPPDIQTGIGKTILELYGSSGKNKETIKEYLKTILPQDPTTKDPNTLFRDILSAK